MLSCAVLLAPFGFDSASNTLLPSAGYFDLPALLISLAVMALLVCGVRDSTRFNNAMVAVKVSIVLFVIGMGAFLVDPANWKPFAPYGWLGISFFGHPVPGQQTNEQGHAGGMLAGSALVFFSFVG